ncbi:methylated-DNA--[protein]-cysteine S-methyltransferase [Serratia proteamaculans]|uniref:methylated-DNA--[protein]-cysteine S-methyltransferase n=1 Tax=Serratia proteamaculans TaxID=28151 RepID=UPI001575EB83|nr:methylated-DNA--[protein]-cysteine S-methyltransferase [Serratia proteamaculans]NTX79001.1 methylated-DNA--[protein]-cysteine S-methyltransferase [Serratia proteamaculans]NTZ26758.1 methylated-DNA--[protein]-cysteine S-methyltransferase [Serratia proteamaculans]
MKRETNTTIQHLFRAKNDVISEPILYAVTTSLFGLVLVGCTTRGICAIFLADDKSNLLTQLRQAFPSAETTESPETLTRQVKQVKDLLENNVVEGEMTLDIGGAAFEQRVWKALCDIPVGTTRSYSRIAAIIGSPDAARAVAGACAANILAVAIPCHRVVRQDGTLSGYRWGVERKRALLAFEAAHSAPGARQ